MMVAAAATVAVATAVSGWHLLVQKDHVINLAGSCTVRTRGALLGRNWKHTLPESGSHFTRSSCSGVGVGRILHRVKWDRRDGFTTALAEAVGKMAAPASSVKERVTGVEISKSLELPGAKGELGLVGVGVREKQIAFLKVKVYAAGFYLDAASAAGDESVAAWKGKSEKELSNNADFFRACAEASVEKAMRLVLVRDVTGNQFWQAFDEALTPRLKATAAGPAGQGAMDALGQMFKSRSFQKGTNVLIFWSQPATLRIDLLSPSEASDGRKAGAQPDFILETPALLPCLFDIFIGKDSVSPSLKSSIASTFPTLWTE